MPISKPTLNFYANQLVEKHGIKLIGKGFNSFVFQHPTMPNVVVKILAANPKDPDYLYAKCALQAKGKNPWMPKVLSIRRLNVATVGTKAYAIFMEKLRRATPEEISHGLTAGGLVGTVLRLKGASWHFVPNCNDAIRAIQDPNLRKVMMVVRYLTAQRFALSDMKRSNFMMRGEQLVFNDPVA